MYLLEDLVFGARLKTMMNQHLNSIIRSPLMALSIYSSGTNLYQNMCERGKILKNSISGITLSFYVEKKVFSPQQGKMSFRGGIFRIYTTFILAAL